MELTAFVQRPANAPTTLSEIKRIHDRVASTDVFGVFAYATQSGVASFDLLLGQTFWENTPSRWLFGIDYGRTQPHALRSMCEKENAEVRVVDGTWLVGQKGFIPQRDFHMKMTIFLNQMDRRFGAVIGSGNFSSNGLRKSIEAGMAVLLGGTDEFRDFLESSVQQAEEIWALATPAEDILDEYEERWRASFGRAWAGGEDEAAEGGDEFDPAEVSVFWIEAGYVTRNRGPDSPGNQIDFPRGITARYFGFAPPNNLPANSRIGPVTFITPVAGPVTNNLRLGNNMMEKISLPRPELHGLDIYDGKVLVFQRSQDLFRLNALEADDFESAFGDRLDDVRVMGSGRRYGFIE